MYVPKRYQHLDSEEEQKNVNPRSRSAQEKPPKYIVAKQELDNKVKSLEEKVKELQAENGRLRTEINSRIRFEQLHGVSYDSVDQLNLKIVDLKYKLRTLLTYKGPKQLFDTAQLLEELDAIPGVTKHTVDTQHAIDDLKKINLELEQKQEEALKTMQKHYETMKKRDIEIKELTEKNAIMAKQGIDSKQLIETLTKKLDKAKNALKNVKAKSGKFDTEFLDAEIQRLKKEKDDAMKFVSESFQQRLELEAQIALKDKEFGKYEKKFAELVAKKESISLEIQYLNAELEKKRDMMSESQSRVMKIMSTYGVDIFSKAEYIAGLDDKLARKLFKMQVKYMLFTEWHSLVYNPSNEDCMAAFSLCKRAAQQVAYQKIQT